MKYFDIRVHIYIFSLKYTCESCFYYTDVIKKVKCFSVAVADKQF